MRKHICRTGAAHSPPAADRLTQMASSGRRRFKAYGSGKAGAEVQRQQSEDAPGFLNANEASSLHSELAQLGEAHREVNESLASLSSLSSSLASTQHSAERRASAAIHAQLEPAHADLSAKHSHLASAQSELSSAISLAQAALRGGNPPDSRTTANALRLAEDARSMGVNTSCVPQCVDLAVPGSQSSQCDGSGMLPSGVCVWCGRLLARSEGDSRNRQLGDPIDAPSVPRQPKSRSDEMEEALLASGGCADVERLRSMYKREIVSLVQKSASKRRSCNPSRGVQTELPETCKRAVQADASEEPISGRELERLRVANEQAERERDCALRERDELQQMLNRSNCNGALVTNQDSGTHEQAAPAHGEARSEGDATAEVRKLCEEVKQSLAAFQQSQCQQQPRDREEEPKDCRNEGAEGVTREPELQPSDMDASTAAADKKEGEAHVPADFSRLLYELEQMKRRVEGQQQHQPYERKQEQHDNARATQADRAVLDEYSVPDDRSVQNSWQCPQQSAEGNDCIRSLGEPQEVEEDLPNARIDAFGFFRLPRGRVANGR